MAGVPGFDPMETPIKRMSDSGNLAHLAVKAMDESEFQTPGLSPPDKAFDFALGQVLLCLPQLFVPGGSVLAAELASCRQPAIVAQRKVTRISLTETGQLCLG